MRHTPCPMPPHSSAKTKLSAAKASQRAVEILATLMLSGLIHIKLLLRLCTLAIKMFSYLGTQTASLSLRTKELPVETEQKLSFFPHFYLFPRTRASLGGPGRLVISEPLSEGDRIEREELGQGAMRGVRWLD